MRAGPLDRRVTVEVKSETRSRAGAVKESWSTVGSYWMGFRQPRASERFVSDQIVAEVDAEFSVHYFTGQSWWPDSHRLVYRGRIYDIRGRREIGRQDGLVFNAKARAEARFDD